MVEQIPCARCQAPTPPAVFKDTGGICRSCQKSVPNPVTVADLAKCLRGNDKRYRGLYFDHFRKRKPTADAVPVLRRALQLVDSFISRCVAIALGKMGPDARDAQSDLLKAASDLDRQGLPQAYAECLTALVAIDRQCSDLIPLIQRFMHLCNWVPISASMRALTRIGSQEAIDLLQELRSKWCGELNKTQKRIADQIVDDALSRTFGEIGDEQCDKSTSQ